MHQDFRHKDWDLVQKVQFNLCAGKLKVINKLILWIRVNHIHHSLTV